MKLTIKGLRNNLNLTQDEMADLLKVSRPTYSRWEQHPKAMPIGYVLQIASMAKCDIKEIDYSDLESL